MSTPEDLSAKLGFIRAFFDDFDAKVAFTRTLAQGGHGDEARLLCCVYLEGIGNWLSGGPRFGAESFARVLIDHGGSRLLGAILPKYLGEQLPARSVQPAILTEIRDVIGSCPPAEAIAYHQWMDAMQLRLRPAAFEVIEKHAWRGTIANAVYSRTRTHGVHWLGSATNLAFSGTMFEGMPVPEIGFLTLHAALCEVAAYARGISISSGMWFGHH